MAAVALRDLAGLKGCYPTKLWNESGRALGVVLFSALLPTLQCRWVWLPCPFVFAQTYGRIATIFTAVD
jgi:hypothetical protein